MACHAMGAPRAQHVGRRDGLRIAAAIERHAHAIRRILDRGYLGTEFDLEAKAGQTIAFRRGLIAGSRVNLNRPVGETARSLLS